MHSEEILKNVKRIVVKVGTSTLTYETGKLNLERLDSLVRELADLTNQGKEVILVTSGAVGAGLGRLGLSEKPKTVPEKQAAAAIGQGVLLHMYEKLFAEYNQIAAQILLTRDDIGDRRRYLNARNTINSLFNYGVIPIVNENDTIAVDEIRLGDNDTLAALVAGLADAELLAILSDIEGLYNANPRRNKSANLISEVTEITNEMEKLAGEPGSKYGTGGMYTKLQAAKICMNSGIPMVLASGAKPQVLHGLLRGERIGTMFFPKEHWLHGRKRWIAFGSDVQGELTVDLGAANAIIEKGKSLLPAGVVAVTGTFEAGNIVSIKNNQGKEIARGIVNYSAADLKRIMGMKSVQIAEVLGVKDYDEIVHRDNMSVAVN